METINESQELVKGLPKPVSLFIVNVFAHILFMILYYFLIITDMRDLFYPVLGDFQYPLLPFIFGVMFFFAINIIYSLLAWNSIRFISLRNIGIFKFIFPFSPILSLLLLLLIRLFISPFFEKVLGVMIG